MCYRLDDDAAVVLLFRQVLVHVAVVGSLVIFLRATDFDIAQEVFITEGFAAAGNFHAVAIARIIRDVHLGSAVFVRDGNLRTFHVFTGEDDAVACGDVEVGNAVTTAVAIEQEGEGVCALPAAQ